MPRILPTSLTGRLIVTSVALVAVISLLVAAVATIVMRSYLTNQVDSQVIGALSRGAIVAGGQVHVDSDDRPTTQGPPPEVRGTREGSITAIFRGTSGTGQSITAARELRRLSSAQLHAVDDLLPGKKPVTRTSRVWAPIASPPRAPRTADSWSKAYQQMTSMTRSAR